MQKPKATIAIPHQGDDRDVTRAVSSALAQSFSDIEVMVVESDWTEGNRKALARFKADPRLRVVRSGSHPGMSEKLDQAVQRASSGLVKFLLPDCELHPECVARMIEAMERHPSAGIVTSPCILLDQNGKEAGVRRHIDEDVLIPGEAAIRRFLLTGVNFIGEPNAVMVRKELYRGFGRTLGITCSEASAPATWLEILQQGDLFHLKAPLCRNHRPSSTQAFDATPSANFAVECSDLVRRYLENGYLANPDLQAASAEAILGRLEKASCGVDFALFPAELSTRYAEALRHWRQHPLVLAHQKAIEALENRSGQVFATTRETGAASTKGTRMPDFSPDLSVILCSRDHAESLRGIFSALERQTLSRDRFEVICVNDGSQDGTRKVMEEVLTRLPGRSIEHPESKGIAAARNTAVTAARGDVLLFLGDDTCPGPDTLRQHLIAHQACAGLRTAVVGPVRFPAHLRDLTLYRAITLSGFFFPADGMEEDPPCGADRISFANLSVSRRALAEGAFFDSALESRWGADLDAGLRLERAGWRVTLCTPAAVTCDHTLTLRDWRQIEAARGRDLVRLLRKHPSIKSTDLGIPDVTQKTQEELTQILAERRPLIDAAVAQIEAVQNLPVPHAPGGDVTPDGERMLTAVIRHLEAIRHYECIRALADARTSTRVPAIEPEDSPRPKTATQRSTIRVVLAGRPGMDPDSDAVTVMNALCRALQAAGIQATTTHDLRPDIRNADLVHGFNVWPPHSALEQLRHLRSTGIPVVWSPFYLDLAEYTWAALAVTAIYDPRHTPEKRRELLRAFALGTLQVNGLDRWKPNEVIPGYHRRLRDMIQNVDHVCAASFREIQALNQVTGFTSLPFTLSPHGVEADPLREASPQLFRARFGLDRFILYVGPVERRKNQLLLLEALRGTGLRAVLVGPTPEEDYLRLCREVGGGNVLITGRLPADLVASAYKAASVHVLPSFAEGAALASLDAAAAGCPLVVSNRSSEVELFGDAPFFCNPNDPGSIREATLRALDSRTKEPERPERLSRFVTAKYTWARAAELTIGAYEKALTAKSRKK